MRYHTWVAVAVTTVGVGANLVGQNAQKKANNAAIAANQNAQTTQNNAAWTNYLMSRGIAPTSPVAAGVLPGAGQYRAVNARLPLWANVGSTGPVKPRKILGVS